MKLVGVLRPTVLMPAGHDPETFCPLSIPLLWPSRLPCVRTPWPPLAPCTPPPALGSAPSAAHMGQHRTQAWSEAASPGSWGTEAGSGTVTQSRFGKGHYWARGQNEGMHNEEKGREWKRKRAHGEEKRGYKKDEEVTTGQSFREDGNKGKTRQRRHSEGREKEKRKGHQEWDKEREGSDWKRFRDMSPSFKSYSMTNKLPLSLPPSHARLTASWLPWWGELPIATGGGVVPWDWQWRQLASDCLVCLSVSVRQAGSLDSTLPVSTVEVICVSLCRPVVVLVYVSGPESGDDPRISVGMTS